ncbi:MAG: pilus assembly protein N-terminal domain-containing protein [Pseudomonadota bacterium]
MARTYKSMLAAAAFAMIGSAHAEQFVVETNKTLPLTLDTDVSSIVVGNPLIADIAVLNERKLLVTGRQFGQTNLIVFDAFGRQTYSVDLVVTATSDGLVTVSRGAESATLDCSSACRELQKNDPGR